MWTKTVTFIKEVIIELKKVSWPQQSEIIESTSVVIITSVLLMFFIWVCDTLLARLVSSLLK